MNIIMNIIHDRGDWDHVAGGVMGRHTDGGVVSWWRWWRAGDGGGEGELVMEEGLGWINPGPLWMKSPATTTPTHPPIRSPPFGHSWPCMGG